MQKVGVLFSLLIAFAMPISVQADETCEHEQTAHSIMFSGGMGQLKHFYHDFAGHSFALLPRQHGWEIAILDGEGDALPIFATSKNSDLTNPVEIAGWQFSDGENQTNLHTRSFAFGHAAEEMMESSNATSTREGDAFSGSGELVIAGLALTLGYGEQRKGMEYIEFDVCLNWDGGSTPPAKFELADVVVANDEIIDRMQNCGLDFDSYKMSDHMAEGILDYNDPYLTLDMDGQGSAVYVVPVSRRADGVDGLAICINDTQLIMVGFSGPIGAHLVPQYFTAANMWGLHEGPVYQSVEETPPPALRGDAFWVGIFESSSVLLYLTEDDEISSYWQGD